jgi:hypothetical protein
MFDTNILVLLYGFAKDFGFGLTGWAIIVWLLWKIATNHLQHLKTDNVEIKEMITTLSADVKASTEKLDAKIEAVDGKVVSLGERTATIEGQIRK